VKKKDTNEVPQLAEMKELVEAKMFRRVPL